MMRWWRGLLERVRVLARRDRFETELDDELRFHLEESTRRNLRRGMSHEEAVRAARRSLGRLDVTKEHVRRETGVRSIQAWLDVSWLDVKLGLRMLVKYPALTLVGGLGMAVAIAISAGFFAILHSYVQPTLPLDEGERVVGIENWDGAANDQDRHSLHDFVTWRDELESVEDLGAFRTVGRNLIVPDGPTEPVGVAEMTASGFRVARVRPLLGRPLVEEDEREGALPVVVIGYDVWQTRFAGDPAIVGRDVRLGNTVHTVVGVMPEGFAFPSNHSFWAPLRADPADYERRQGPEIYVFGRLAPGVTFEEAQAEL
ncbi:MAG: ABC transporter permease, partial [Longimicrobiales bacterium]